VTAAALVAAHAVLLQALAGWNGGGAVPSAVARPALKEQKLEYRIADARKPLPQLPRDLHDDVFSIRELARLSRPRPLRAFRVCRARPAVELRGYYAEAQRRYRVRWQLLAAVNFVESDFGRLCNRSTAGAQGPMQFMPSTWRTYGRGDVHDPHQAILGAARFLVAAGLRRSEGRALYRYNPSWLYVDAIQRFEGRIRRDSRAYLGYYARQLFVRTPAGRRRLTSFGLR
jgi:membrane-bound lytic murein transglycosylase B